MSQASVPILSVRDLHVRLWTKSGIVRAVNGISHDLGRGEVLGIVGESGSGKSMAMLAVMGLLDAALVDAVAGSVTVGGRTWADAGSDGIADGSGSRARCWTTVFSTAPARFCQRWNRSATWMAPGAPSRAASA